MNSEYIQKLYYAFNGHDEVHTLPSPIIESFQLITSFFLTNTNNKLCLVFSSKELISQWLSIPLTLNQILRDYNLYRNEISESYKYFQVGEKLLLNNSAVVEWVGLEESDYGGSTKKAALFRTKSTKYSESLNISISLEKITKLQKTNKKVLSSQKMVMDVLPKQSITPLDELLNIKTYGNKEFIKSKTCLIAKYKSFIDSIDNVSMNHANMEDYFPVGKIDENGLADNDCPLLLANNLSNFALYSVTNQVAKIVIDGISAIQERATDFSDIDVKGIPTILITDLSEIDSFELISNYGFDFFNFTKEYLGLDNHIENSPFHVFNSKIEKYINFNLVKNIYHDSNLNTIAQKIHAIEKDDSNVDLSTLKVHLIKLTNLISRICHSPSVDEISYLSQTLCSIEKLFQQSCIWLGDSKNVIAESIALLKSVVENLVTQPSEKCAGLNSLMNEQSYDYIICPTDDEAQALKNSLTSQAKTQVISVADINNNLLSNKPAKAILTGWTKSNNFNRIITSFMFSELSVLFYQFENKYYNSLQRRNINFCDCIKPTVDSNGIHFAGNSEKSSGFNVFYYFDEIGQTKDDSLFDILEFELKIDNAEYSKYSAKGNMIDSIKAKRIDFENDLFVYSSESHKFLVIKEIIEKKGKRATLHREKLDSLKPGDIIAFINTDRDILAELVEKNTNKQDFAAVKRWTDLWKNLLKEYFFAHESDFNKLVEELRKNECKKHEATIRTWLQDENRIGPKDDSDLISIALLTNSEELFKNISKARGCISKMVGWRMQAADHIASQIEKQIQKRIDKSLINSKVEIEGLGSITILKTIHISNIWEDIDVRFVNKLLEKELL